MPPKKLIRQEEALEEAIKLAGTVYTGLTGAIGAADRIATNLRQLQERAEGHWHKLMKLTKEIKEG